MLGRTRFFLQSENYGRRISMRIVHVDVRGTGDVVAEAMPLTFRDARDANEQSAEWSAPVAAFHRDEAQDLMDQLWSIGFRPERGEMSVGQIAATEKHLTDMRAIVFAKLEVPKP